MKRGLTGKYEIKTVGGEKVRAFIPDPLPPREVVDLSGKRHRIFVYENYIKILSEGL